MNRVRDYIGFAMTFAGLGYGVLWLAGALDVMMLSPPLHIVGVAATVFACVNLLLRAVRSRRRAGAGRGIPAANDHRHRAERKLPHGVIDDRLCRLAQADPLWRAPAQLLQQSA